MTPEEIKNLAESNLLAIHREKEKERILKQQSLSQETEQAILQSLQKPLRNITEEEEFETKDEIINKTLKKQLDENEIKSSIINLFNTYYNKKYQLNKKDIKQLYNAVTDQYMIDSRSKKIKDKLSIYYDQDYVIFKIQPTIDQLFKKYFETEILQQIIDKGPEIIKNKTLKI